MRAGVHVDLKVGEKVRFGEPVLLADEAGRNALAAGVVLGENNPGRRRTAERVIVVTHGLESKPVRLTGARATTSARHATRREAAALEALPRTDSPWSNILETSRNVELPSRRTEGKATREKDAQIFLRRLLEGAGLRVAMEFGLPGAHPADDPRRPRQADLIAHLPRGRTDHLVVIETEWTQSGDFESAAQAYEYAVRLRHYGHGARQRVLLDLAPQRVREAVFHAVVVANLKDTCCFTADHLRVHRLLYREFADRVADGGAALADMPALPGR